MTIINIFLQLQPCNLLLYRYDINYVLCFNFFTKSKDYTYTLSKESLSCTVQFVAFLSLSSIRSIQHSSNHEQQSTCRSLIYNPIQAKCPHQPPTSLSKSRHSAINGHSGLFIHTPNPLFLPSHPLMVIIWTLSEPLLA